MEGRKVYEATIYAMLGKTALLILNGCCHGISTVPLLDDLISTFRNGLTVHI